MTNEEINALTDPQINVMMTECIYDVHDHELADEDEFVRLPLSNGFPLTVSNTLYKVGNGVSLYPIKDYCNDPAAMMQIAFENGIGYVSGDGMVLAMKIHSAMENADGRIEINPDVKFIEYSDKVCRALAIVYLKSKGVL